MESRILCLTNSSLKRKPSVLSILLSPTTTALSKENLRSLTNANGFLLLSSASDELNHTLTADDVTLNFDVSDEEWIYVINDINVVTNGSVSYTHLTLPTNREV